MRNAPRVDPSTERRLSGLLALVLCGLAGFAPAQPLTPLRLQIAISSEEPIAWRGDLSLSEGRLEKLQPLNLDPVAAASLRMAEGRLSIKQQRPQQRDLFNVTARRPSGAELVITPADARGQQLEPVPVSLDRVLEEPQSVSVGAEGVRFTVSRVANDRLRIESDRTSLLFAPGEEFAFDLLADPPGMERGRSYDITASLQRGRGGEEVWRGETTRVEAPAVGAARLPIAVPLPDGEGVYTVCLSVTRPPGFLSRFPRTGSPPLLAERTFQVAVLDPHRTPVVATSWNETHVFEPGAATWVRRVPEWMRWRRLPWPQQGPLSSEEQAPPETISPRDASACHWRAYPLPIEQPGVLHAVEVQVEGDPGQALTVALVEPNALGELRPLGPAVTRPARRWNREQGALTLRLAARPRTTTPLLVLTNPSGKQAIRFGRIRLLRAVEQPVESTALERLVALDWTSVDLPHALGASHAPSAVGRFEHADLLTHYETAQALAERVQIAGANGAVISVNERGGAVYPSSLWTTPRFDLGCWADGAGDLPRRELLALVGREFRRRGLRLMLGIRFDDSSPRALAPDFEPAALEEAILALGDTDVLAGIVVRVGVDGAAASNREAAELPIASAARSLRYERLASLLARRLPGAELLIAPSGVASKPSGVGPLTPRLGGAASEAERFVQQIGLGRIAATTRGVHLLTPIGGHGVGDSSSGSAGSARLEVLRESLGLSGEKGPLAFRSDRQTLRLQDTAGATRETDSPAGLMLESWIADPTTEGALLAAAAGRQNATLIVDGATAAGWIESIGSDRRQTLTRVPAPPLVREPTIVDGGDVTAVAYDVSAEESIAVASNRSAWPQRARLTLETPTRVRAKPLESQEGDAEWFEPGQYPIDLTLAPHQTVGWRFAGAGVQVVGLRTEPNPAAAAELATAVADLQSRDTTARRSFEAIPNASFELSDGSNPFLGWSASDGVSREAEAAFDGTIAARLSASDGQTAVLTSDPFPMPVTGQMALSLRVRPGRLGPDTQLTIDLEQTNGDYRKGTRVAVNQLVPRASTSDDKEWLPPIVFPIDDLPLDQAGRLRLRFTLSGQGELHLDDVQAEDLLLPLDGYGSIALRAEKFALVRLLSSTEQLLDEGRLAACRERLDGYWARFLIDNFPIHEPEPEVANELTEGEAESVAEDSAAEDEVPSISQRLRGYLPRWWR